MGCVTQPIRTDSVFVGQERITGSRNMNTVTQDQTGIYCPICETRAAGFLAHGRIPRLNALCPGCGLLERHRIAWLYFQRKTDLLDGTEKQVLHIAPEGRFQRRMKSKLGAGYLSGDLFDPAAMVKMDIMDIQYPDASFDVIYCGHVLEHVDDDRQAMREFHRVLRPDGWAVLMVPITAERTFEDPSIKDPAERLRLFGQEDHVRCYGPDFTDRLRDAGFDVDMVKPSEFIEAHELQSMALTPSARPIFHCVKQMEKM